MQLLTCENAICERVIGTIRRECLDWLIPLSESHLRSILKSWILHYNRARPLWPWVPVSRHRDNSQRFSTRQTTIAKLLRNFSHV
jgi:transposase InsO family protein